MALPSPDPTSHVAIFAMVGFAHDHDLGVANTRSVGIAPRHIHTVFRGGGVVVKANELRKYIFSCMWWGPDAMLHPDKYVESRSLVGRFFTTTMRFFESESVYFFAKIERSSLRR